MKFLNFERIIGLSSIFIATCAAFFSIIGIGMLFSGSAIAAMIMAMSLEVGKLVATSFLYRYWKKTKNFLKLYLTTSVIVLMVITSLGIFGYLSSAYQQSNIENQLIEQKVKLVEDQKISIKERVEISKTRITNITKLRNSQEDRLTQSITNNLIARNPVQMRQIQQQTQDLIEQSEKDIENESLKIQKAADDLQKLDDQITSLKVKSGEKKDVQTFKFVAEEFGVSMNKVVKWFIIALISVFDPLAICLLLAYNTAIFVNKENKPINDSYSPTKKESTFDIIENTNMQNIVPSTVSSIEKAVPEALHTQLSADAVIQAESTSSATSTESNSRHYPFSF